MDLLDIYEEEVSVSFKGEDWLVRDNGSVLRLPKNGKKPRPKDNQWSFGNQDSRTGYMNFVGVRVHRIVAAAFHGNHEETQLVVDHIDTNRANNRPENLRWITRVENVLLNPVTARRIELAYGSIDAFFDDPSKYQAGSSSPDIEWMRTVSKDEAKLARERLEQWAASGKIPTGGALGEWLFSADEPIPDNVTTALTPNAAQVDWRIPSVFPACPSERGEGALELYQDNLVFGEIFVTNDYYESKVVQSELCGENLFVLTNSVSGMKPWAIAKIFNSGSIMYHANHHQYFTLAGALKVYCELTQTEFEDTIDDYS